LPDAELEFAAEIVDCVDDMNMGWDEPPHAQRLEAVRDLGKVLPPLRLLVYERHIGRRRQQTRGLYPERLPPMPRERHRRRAELYNGRPRDLHPGDGAHRLPVRS